MRFLLMVILCLGLGLAPGVAGAQSAAHKLGRGLAALTTGFLEIPGHMVKEAEVNGWGSGASLGLARGLGAGLVRYLVGTYEVISSPFPIPEGFKPIIQPEFPWNHFDKK